ncbi:MAG: hypothetical protein A2Y97_06570 [Nitrospirae bacterium RBG_13_39_12]|nr:MAG: hypothetical protein A2Y97_06570 [Nitrospirae bacterium RBG_13_39_12]
MCKARYSFEKVDDYYEFYDFGVFQLRFKRGYFRDAFELYASENGRSSNWIGSMLKILCEKFPMPYPVSKRNDAERFVTRYGDEAGVEKLRSLGFKVGIKTDFPVYELVEIMKKRGYEVEDLVLSNLKVK